jgi:hypothetical protein
LPDGAGRRCQTPRSKRQPDEHTRIRLAKPWQTFDKRSYQKQGGKMPTTTIQYFNYEHLGEFAPAISKPIHDLAHWVENNLPDGPEKSAGMRKLLEAKDCFVRASLTQNCGKNESGASRRKSTCPRCGKFIEVEVNSDGSSVCPFCENGIIVL